MSTAPVDPDRAGALVSTAPALRTLTSAAVRHLADVPPALTWFANIDNP